MIHEYDTFLERIHIKTIMMPFVENGVYHEGIAQVKIVNNLDDRQYSQQIAGDLDIIAYRGADFYTSIQYTTEQNEPYNLQNYSVEANAFYPKEPDKLLTLNCIITDAVNGMMEIFISADEIERLIVNNSTTYMNYYITISSNITKRTYRILQGILKLQI